jgi:hypothetical protein
MRNGFIIISSFVDLKTMNSHYLLGTEDKEVQQTTAHLMLQPATVGWRWQQSSGQASKFSIS